MPVGPRRSPPPAPRLHEPIPRRGDRRPRRRVSSSPANDSRRLASRLQFFVRTDGRTLVLRANSSDTVQSVHERIRLITKIPVVQQRLIYGGKQLQREKSLAECAIRNDAELYLVVRIRSKGHQQARRIIGDMISLVHGLCKGETVPNALKTIKTKISEYLSMTPKKDGHPATEHLQIFMSSSAPAALVMLYTSTIGGNKDLAEESIRHFLKSCITELPESLRSHCAPIVLEFCRRLWIIGLHDPLYRRLRIRGPHDPLYLSCRSSFQSMIKFTKVQWVSEHTKSVKRAIFIKGIFPFVKELADKLSKDLELSLHTIANAETWSNICDFTMFLCPLRTVMSGYIGFEHPISLPMEIEHRHVLLCKEEVESLYQIFEDMLKKMDKCLLRIEQPLSAIVSGGIDIACPEWSRYLFILKELNAISKLYLGSEEQFWTILRMRKRALCMLVVRYAKRSDDHKWLLERKDIMDFESIVIAETWSDICDLTMFLHPLQTVMSGYTGCEHPVSLPMENEHRDVLFEDMLKKMDKCLLRVEQHLSANVSGEIDIACPEWSRYLTILKELNAISKLYLGSEEQFWTILSMRKRALCMLVVRYAKRSDDHKWLLEHKDIMDFESRRHLVMMMFPEVKEYFWVQHEMLIDRSQLLSESFEYIANAKAESLHGGIFMEFKNEEATGPGVLREWFVLVCQAIFDQQNPLFVACPNDRRRFYPNPASTVEPLHLKYFNFSGRMIGLALMHKVQVGIVLDRVFFLQLGGYSISLEDIRDADPYMYNSCKQILEMDTEFIDSDALGLTFVREVEELGLRRVVELCDGGKGMVVNSNNRNDYVDLLIKDRFVTSISQQVSHFAQGFGDILSDLRLQKFFFQSLELEDIDQMLHGSENDISVEDWKAHTEYNGYKSNDPQIVWFWKIVSEMSPQQKKNMLFFWTSVKYLPVEGFRGLASRLYIYKSTAHVSRLPSSHTCFYSLCFPPYPSMTIMQQCLSIIAQELVGCSFGTR